MALLVLPGLLALPRLSLLSLLPLSGLPLLALACLALLALASLSLLPLACLALLSLPGLSLLTLSGLALLSLSGLSLLTLSGMVTIRRIPLAAQARASPTPVLPLVASMTVVFSLIKPRWVASSMIASAVRSFTLDIGFSDSSFNSRSASRPVAKRGARTSGVLPITSRIES